MDRYYQWILLGYLTEIFLLCHKQRCLSFSRTITFMIQNSGSIINLCTGLGTDLFSKENSRSEL